MSIVNSILRCSLEGVGERLREGVHKVRKTFTQKKEKHNLNRSIANNDLVITRGKERAGDKTTTKRFAALLKNLKVQQRSTRFTERRKKNASRIAKWK